MADAILHITERKCANRSGHRSYSIQIEGDLYLVSPAQPDPGDYVNHSCHPNTGLSGQVALVATRAIHPGEEICYDYAMSDGSDYDELDCVCGATLCRGRVTGNDWRLADLQRRYAGYFSPYIQRRIDAMQGAAVPLAAVS